MKTSIADSLIRRTHVPQPLHFPPSNPSFILLKRLATVLPRRASVQSEPILFQNQMLNCQSCQTRLVIYSSHLDHSLEQLEAILNEDTDSVIPDALKAEFLLQKQLKIINPDYYIVSDSGNPSSTPATTPVPASQLSQSLTDPDNETLQSLGTPTNLIPLADTNTYYHTNNLLVAGTLTKQHESNQSLIPDDGSLGFSIIEQRITKVSRLLSLLTNLTLIHHPLCPKCCHDLNLKLSRYCQQLDGELENLLTTELDLVQIAFGNKIKSKINQYAALPMDKRVEALLDHSKDQDDESNFISQLKQTLTSDELLNQQIISLYNEEECLRDEVGALEYEMWQLQQEEAELEQFTSYISQLEDNFVATFLDMKQGIANYWTLNRAIKSKLEQQQSIHNALSLTSPIFDLMTIDLQSPIPSISGFRLGRSEDYLVDWFEINAAFGQICLLLDILRRGFNLTFREEIQLYPIGHRSYISRLGSIFPLYRESNDGMHTAHFKVGCEIMLSCIRQLYESQMFFVTPVPSTIIGSGTSQQSLEDNGNVGFASNNSIPGSSQSGQSSQSSQNAQNGQNGPQSGQNSNPTKRSQAQSTGPGYQPHLQYQHESNTNTTGATGASTGASGTQLSYQQPQYDTAKYAQMVAGAGVAVIPAMSSSIQPPHIVIGDEGKREVRQDVRGAKKVTQLPGITLSSSAPQDIFICSINGCELEPENQGMWVNAMRQVLMALFQLMLLSQLS